MTNNTLKFFVTHAGIFHADEVFATAMLRIAFPVYNLRRVFKVTPNMYSPNSIVYDIGGGELDHHTAENKRDNGFHPGTEIPYASCGLVWKKYGLEALHAIGVFNHDTEVHACVEKALIHGIDAIDNGMDVTGEAMSVSQIIYGFNPTWEEDTPSDVAFMRAVDFADTVLRNCIRGQKAKVRARELVEKAINEAGDSQIVVLPQYLPWQESVLPHKNILYVVYPSLRGGYNAQAVPAETGSFENRLPFPEAWRGVSADKLAKVSGVPTLHFCHVNGFLIGTDTLDDAIKAAKLSASEGFASADEEVDSVLQKVMDERKCKSWDAYSYLYNHREYLSQRGYKRLVDRIVSAYNMP